MIRQFFNFEIDSRALIVKEGDTLCTGRHTFTFVMAPMVHWPEAMVTYDVTDKVLFSADAFGTFGALNGGLFADEYDFETEWLPDARRYFTNIVGKYGTQVRKRCWKKAAGIEIETICPLHGPVWRRTSAGSSTSIQKWSTYTPEDKAVMIAYALGLRQHAERSGDFGAPFRQGRAQHRHVRRFGDASLRDRFGGFPLQPSGVRFHHL